MSVPPQRPTAGKWQSRKLHEIAPDGAPILYGILQPGPDLPDGVPYVRPTEIVDDIIDLESVRRTSPTIAAKYKRSVLKPNDVILSIVGTIGKVALVPPDLEGGNITQSSVRIRVRPDIALSRYIAWALRSPVLVRQFDKHRLGTAVPRLNVAHVRALEIPLPDLDEQRRIVAEIEKQFTRLDAGVTALRRVQGDLKRYRAAVLKAACEGRLVPTEADLARKEGRTFETGEQLLQRILLERRKKWAQSDEKNSARKYLDAAVPEIADFPVAPKGWTWATADQLTDQTRSITYGVIKLGAHVSHGVPVLRSSDVRHLRLDLQDVKRVAPDIAAEYRRTFLQGSEVLVTVRGTLGGVVVTPVECEGFNISREVAMLAMVEPQIAKSAAVFIGSSPLQRWLLRRTKGIAYTGINIETLKQLPIPLPPLAEQTRIVVEVERRLSVLDDLQSVVSANLQRTARLRQSILQKAFTGSL